MKNKTLIPCSIYEDDKVYEIAKFWALKALTQIETISTKVNKYGFDSDCANWIGVEKHEKDDDVYKALKSRLEEFDALEAISCNEVLLKNIEDLSFCMQFNSVEQKIIMLLAYLSQCAEFGDMFSMPYKINKIFRSIVISVVLDEPASVITKALSKDAALIKSGFLKVNRYSDSLNNSLEFFDNDVANILFCSEGGAEQIQDMIALKCSKPTLDLQDFAHLKGSEQFVLRYLGKSLKSKQQGVNILLYGEPGTGKTELAKVLAKNLNIELKEIGGEIGEDDKNRFDNYMLAQYIYAQSPMLLLFDEVEDVFDASSGNIFRDSKKQDNKLLINRWLETNPVPTIWITNDVSSIDRAIIRRFKMCMEIPIPSIKKKEEILSSHCGGVLSKKEINLLASHKHLSPAIIDNAVSIADTIKSRNKSTVIINTINQTLKAQRFDEIKEKEKASFLPKTYNPSFINTSIDTKRLLEGIKRSKSAKMCFYGAPGTGKSAFGKWIAKSLKRDFIAKKVSDLKSMYVGGTERNIAAAFEEAKEKKAVLIFDEVDTFLSDRKNAQRSWEVSEVNEMLVQMEEFEGVFIATTNLMANLDAASLRRFDVKLEFLYMTHDVSLKMLCDEVKELGLPTPDKSALNSLKHLNVLTPGDFATIKRQHRFYPIKDAADFVERLSDECKLKSAESTRIGF
ncbi:MAG: ATP-binding protein [Campylobacteraceae bacterium]|jgi:SpoVK/Ycf46/Vps4 family AAA+-type ATPase|nr:ATP-binding protein [Campylobacteraceae bacterium]